MGISFISPEIRSVSPSPQKKKDRSVGKRRLTIIKRMDLQSTIDINMKQAKANEVKNSSVFNGGIAMDEEPGSKRPTNILSATLLQLKSIARAPEPSQDNKEKNGDEQDSDGNNND